MSPFTHTLSEKIMWKQIIIFHGRGKGGGGGRTTLNGKFHENNQFVFNPSISVVDLKILQGRSQEEGGYVIEVNGG